MSHITKYILEFIAGLGGGAVIVTIVLKFMKERIAKFIDQEIELRTSKALANYERELEKTKMAYTLRIGEEWKSLIILLRELHGMRVFLGQLEKAIEKISSQNKPYNYVARESCIRECEIINSVNTKMNSLKSKFETESIFLSRKTNEEFEVLWRQLDKVLVACEQLQYCGTSCQNEFSIDYKNCIIGSGEQVIEIIDQMKEKIDTITGEQV